MMENRYDRYKDSGIAWIGEIPEHWKVAKIKSFYNVILGKMVERNNDSNTGDENYLCAANIKWNGVDTEINKKMYFSDIEKEKYLLQYNDVLIMEGGMAGTACLYKNEFSPCYVQNSVNVCRAKKDFNNKFLYYWMYVPYYNGYIDAICNKATIKHYTKEKVQNTPILISSLVEQQSIAAYLDQKCGEIDELITLQEEMITKLQSYKQSVITEAVTKGLNKNVPLKDSGIEWIGEIPEHWICTVFKRFLLEPMQYGANEPAEECNYYDPRYIRITDIKDDGTLRDDTFKSLPLGKAKEYMLTKGDLLFARSGATVGKTFLYKEDYAACFAGYLIKARCNKNKLVPNFVFYYTLSNVYQNWKNSIFIQSTIQNIGADKYSVMPIIVPPLSEQQSIADYLDQRCSEIDELISIKQQKIEKLKEYKKSLIFECVTGKRKVS